MNPNFRPQPVEVYLEFSSRARSRAELVSMEKFYRSHSLLKRSFSKREGRKFFFKFPDNKMANAFLIQSAQMFDRLNQTYEYHFMTLIHITQQLADSDPKAVAAILGYFKEVSRAPDMHRNTVSYYVYHPNIDISRPYEVVLCRHNDQYTVKIRYLS